MVDSPVSPAPGTRCDTGWVTVTVSEQWEREAFATGLRVLGQSRVPMDVVVPVGYLRD